MALAVALISNMPELLSVTELLAAASASCEMPVLIPAQAPAWATPVVPTAVATDWTPMLSKPLFTIEDVRGETDGFEKHRFADAT